MCRESAVALLSITGPAAPVAKNLHKRIMRGSPATIIITGRYRMNADQSGVPPTPPIMATIWSRLISSFPKVP